MSWSISNAMMKAYENSRFSQEQVAASSEADCSGGTQSAPLSTTPTPDQYYWPDKTTEHSRLSRFGMTCVPLTAIHGEALLTWFREDFLAKTSVLRARVPDSMEREAAFGQRWQGSFAKFSLDSFSWKTAQYSLLGDSELFSETWPRWGSMRNGACYLRQIPALPIYASESGLWPTPCASDNSDRAVSQSVHITSSGLPKHVAENGQKSQMRLSQAAKMWPTPNASDGSKWSNQSLAERKEKGQQVRLNTAVAPEGGMGGQLNPNWVEWLMGWPIGQTDLKPLETAKFQEWLLQHGEY